MKPKLKRFNHSHEKSLAASLFISTLFLVFIAFPAVGQGAFSSLKKSILGGITLLFPTLIIFLIFFTGKIYRWRKIFFITYAIAFAISFVWWTMGDRGHMWLLDSEILYSQTPMCHFVVPMLILPLVFTKELIFPIPLLSAGFMILLVIIVSIIYGRAFCSWGCFYGGQDELFASIPKKKKWDIKNIHPFVRYFAFGLLAFIVLHSFLTMSPTYCWWLCPFKATTEFVEVNSFIRVIQTYIFIAIWVGLVIVLPLVTKKRTQCAFFCPMGAFFSCTSKLNLFSIKIDKDRCSDCGHCISVCPTFSLTKESLAAGKPLSTCTKCGACIESCPKNVIHYRTKGVHFTAGNHPKRIGANPSGLSGWKRFAADVWSPDVVFVFGIFALSVMIASGFFVDAMARLAKLFFGV